MQIITCAVVPVFNALIDAANDEMLFRTLHMDNGTVETIFPYWTETASKNESKLLQLNLSKMARKSTFLISLCMENNNNNISEEWVQSYVKNAKYPQWNQVWRETRA